MHNMPRLQLQCLVHAQVAPPLQINGKGKLVRKDTRQPAQLHGFNAFGWNTGAFNVFDGLWAYCDGERLTGWH